MKNGKIAFTYSVFKLAFDENCSFPFREMVVPFSMRVSDSAVGARTTTTTWPNVTLEAATQKQHSRCKAKMSRADVCSKEEVENDHLSKEYCADNDSYCTKSCRCCAPCPDNEEHPLCGIHSTTRRPRKARSSREYFIIITLNLNQAPFSRSIQNRCKNKCIKPHMKP